MGDVFKEQLVKKQRSSKDTLILVGLIAAAFVLIMIVSYISTIVAFVSQISIFIFMGIVFGGFVLNSRLKKEFEYIYTNGELDIDTITNKSRRKRSFSQDVKNFELVVHNTLMADHKNEFNNCNQTLDFSSGKVTESTYYILTVYKGKKTKIIIEPNEKILQAFSTALTPRKLLKRR